MKKSSYILIALGVLILLGSFFFPSIMMKRMELKLITVRGDDKTTLISTGMFMTLALDLNDIDVLNPDNTVRGLDVTITAVDTLKTPTVRLSKAWEPYSKITESGDTLTLRVAPYNVPEGERLSVEPSAFKLCEIQVPANMLRTIRSNGMLLTIQDFQDANLKVPYAGNTEYRNCSFKLLETTDWVD